MIIFYLGRPTVRQHIPELSGQRLEARRRPTRDVSHQPRWRCRILWGPPSSLTWRLLLGRLTLLSSGLGPPSRKCGAQYAPHGRLFPVHHVPNHILHDSPRTGQAHQIFHRRSHYGYLWGCCLGGGSLRNRPTSPRPPTLPVCCGTRPFGRSHFMARHGVLYASSPYVGGSGVE